MKRKVNTEYEERQILVQDGKSFTYHISEVSKPIRFKFNDLEKNVFFKHRMRKFYSISEIEEIVIQDLN